MKQTSHRKTSPRYNTLREYVDAQPRRKTQREIAQELGLSHNGLSQYLSGSRRPNREIALRLSRQLGIPLENILDPPPQQERAS